MVIIVEDDLEIVFDFFEYFEVIKVLFDKDFILWCVLVWNDNGKIGRVKGNDLFYRIDFFFGLGWMLKKFFWEELVFKWFVVFWDDWMWYLE